MANNIDHKPEFDWWALFTLYKWNRIFYKLQKKYWHTTYKFGIVVPTSVEQAYDINNKTVTDFCRKLISKEMLKVTGGLQKKEETLEQIWSGEARLYLGFQEVACHIIIGFEMNFSRKAWMVANGAMTEAPLSLTYYSIA